MNEKNTGSKPSQYPDALYSFYYSYTFEDAMALQNCLSKKNWFARFKIISLLIIVFSVIGFVIAYWAQNRLFEMNTTSFFEFFTRILWEKAHGLLKIIFILTAGYFLMIRLFKFALRSTLQKIHTTLEDVELHMTHTGIAYIFSDIHVETPWVAIRSVEYERNHVILILNTHAGYVIPQRAAKNPDQFNDFKQAIEKKIKNISTLKRIPH